MIQAVSSVTAMKARKTEIARASGFKQWRTEFIGTRAQQVEEHPQAFLVEMDANGEIRPHFHQVNQFQIFVAGNGNLGRNAAPLIALHYVDHHTAYGPITAGPFGFSMFTIRQNTDPGGIYLHMPHYKEMLRPSKKRYLLTENISLSTGPVLQNREAVSFENVFDTSKIGDDGLAAVMLRMGAFQRRTGPNPTATGGQYYVVLNGDLEFEGKSYPTWSIVHVGARDPSIELGAGACGAEVLILSFPQGD